MVPRRNHYPRRNVYLILDQKWLTDKPPSKLRVLPPPHHLPLRVAIISLRKRVRKTGEISNPFFFFRVITVITFLRNSILRYVWHDLPTSTRFLVNSFNHIFKKALVKRADRILARNFSGPDETGKNRKKNREKTSLIFFPRSSIVFIVYDLWQMKTRNLGKILVLTNWKINVLLFRTQVTFRSFLRFCGRLTEKNVGMKITALMHKAIAALQSWFSGIGRGKTM